MRLKIVIGLLLCLTCFQVTLQRSTPEDASYVAAVLEYQVESNNTINLQQYLAHIQDAASQGADIVVFPEMTLARGESIEVPILGALKDYPVPALMPTLYHSVLVALSEAARASEIYVVVNVQELMNCETNTGDEDCPDSSIYRFNTNVVFDRSGAVIDRYRKINLFGEYSRNPAFQPDLGMFSTDFGVTFGHFICFDLMFQVPAVQVVEKNNITDVVFTTMWFSEMPYLTAVQIQQAYAYSLNINFLASGANNVRVGSAGSGIYSGKAGALISTMPGQPTTRLLVARVPKVPGAVTETYPGPIYDPPTEADTLLLKRDPTVSAHVTRPLVPGSQEFTLSHNEVTCSFRVVLSQRAGDVVPKFRAVLHDGSNTYVKREIGVASCVVMACEDDDVKSCPDRYNSTNTSIMIEEIDIKMMSYRVQYNKTLQCDNQVYFPDILTTSKFPLNPKNFTFEDSERSGGKKSQNGGREHVTIKLNKPQNDLVTFGIWARIYTKDVHHGSDTTIEEMHQFLQLQDSLFVMD